MTVQLTRGWVLALSLIAPPLIIPGLPALAETAPARTVPAQTTPSDPPPAIVAPNAAVDPALDAEAFDRLTLGKTMDTHDSEVGRYGIETFLPGHRVIWSDAEGCTHGTWRQVGQQICFDYENNNGRSICWSYHDRGGWIMGWFEGRRDTVPIMLYPSKDTLSCAPQVGA